jgi:hypothetical protein
MSKGYLSSYFEAFAVKRLSSVEISPNTSNQHEFNGIAALRDILGEKKKEYNAKIFYFGEDEDKNLTYESTLTWYDARANHPTRTEYRLYYSDSLMSELAIEGDLLFIIKKSENLLFLIIARSGSTYESNLLWLFNIQNDLVTDEFFSNRIDQTNNKVVDYSIKTILAKLGIDAVQPDNSYLDMLIDNFGERFPSTREFSLFARNTIDIEMTDPDDCLIKFMEHEEILFRTLEEHLLNKKINKGFKNADDFISFSLSVQNRRKSRAGYALENHLEYIFNENKINYSRGKITENKSRPDFIFPNIDFYHDTDFPDSKLTMLGVKSTCKDRWRQILAEANRISYKHLFTLEPGISDNQTNEMHLKNVQLVIPTELFDTFKDSQKGYLINLISFIEMVKTRQII